MVCKWSHITSQIENVQNIEYMRGNPKVYSNSQKLFAVSKIKDVGLCSKLGLIHQTFSCGQCESQCESQ